VTRFKAARSVQIGVEKQSIFHAGRAKENIEVVTELDELEIDVLVEMDPIHACMGRIGQRGDNGSSGKYCWAVAQRGKTS
jgi:hypothetical protein